MSSPTQRSIKVAKELGFRVHIAERWNPYARRRVDMFGGIDLVLIRAGVGIVGVQACAGASHSARREKLRGIDDLREWIESGGRLEVWSWAKRGERGKRKTWTLRREELKAEDITTA